MNNLPQPRRDHIQQALEADCLLVKSKAQREAEERQMMRELGITPEPGPECECGSYCGECI